MNSPRVELFVQQSLELSALYLGYAKQFRNFTAFVDLSGSRNNVDIHNLNNTRLTLSSTLSLVRCVLTRSAALWIVMPNSSIILTASTIYSLRLISKQIMLWVQKWIPGLFTNRTAFYPLREFYRYPSLLFYPSSSIAKQAQSDGVGSNIIQLGVSDSNDSRIGYTYAIPANEKSPRSNTLFVKLLIRVSLSKSMFIKNKFFIKNAN